MLEVVRGPRGPAHAGLPSCGGAGCDHGLLPSPAATGGRPLSPARFSHNAASPLAEV